MKDIVKIVLLSGMVLLAGTLGANAQYKKNHKKFSNKKVVYANKSPKVATIKYLPKTSKKVVYKKSNYAFYKGRYYKTLQGKHIVVAPPRGLRIKVLPVGFIRIALGPHHYYYYEGVYYRDVEETDEFEVVDAPIGAMVDEIPFDAEVVVYDGKVYYEYLDILYKKVETPEGDAYEIVGQLED